MRIVLFLSIVTMLSVGACQTNQKETRQQLYDEVMRIHDETMADMGKLNQLQEVIQDSLKLDSLAEGRQLMFENANDQLILADSVMWEWMHAFDQGAAAEKSDTAIQYLKKEMERIKYVQEAMNDAIKSGKRSLNKAYAMNRVKLLAIFSAMTFLLAACGPDLDNRSLPILGERSIENGDTTYHTIPDFRFIDQDSNVITNATFRDKYYVADFFFTSCPTICPKVKAQVMRIYETFDGNDSLLFLSHSIDTRRDSVPVLKKYADKLEIDSRRWHLVTGKKEDIYGINEDYFIAAMEAPDAPGGFDHSGKIVLVDKNRQIRSFADGTDPEAVDRFIRDIEKLLNE